MIHWAMVTTIALHFKGVYDKCYRKTLGRALTADLNTAITKLDEIFTATSERRLDVLKEQRFLMHSLDNYNCFQPFSLQRVGRSGIFHNGIGYNAALPNEFNKPIGTLLLNRIDGARWRVLSSSLTEDFHKCIVVAELEQMPTKVIAASADNDDDDASEINLVMSQTITLPSVDWKCVMIHGASPPVEITYVNQQISPSLGSRVPIGIDDYTLVTGN